MRARCALVLGLGHRGHCSAAACYDPPAMHAARMSFVLSCASWSSSRCRAIGVHAAPRDPFTLDRAAERWVEQTMKKLTADEKIGQLIVPSFESNFLSTDSDTFDTLTRLVRDYHVGGFHVFGAIDAGAVGAAESRLRDGHPRPAVFRRVSHQPAAGAVGGAAAEHGRLRDRRRLPHLRRDPVPAADGDGRDLAGWWPRPAPRARGSADHRRRIAGASAST